MPGLVQNATPLAVMPASLSRAFAHERGYPMIESEYRNGESQRSVQAANSRKRWRMTKRLALASSQALRSFYDARRGPVEPFFFYDPFETNPRFSHDPSGAAVQGRHTVRFSGDWSHAASLGRADVALELIEVS